MPIGNINKKPRGKEVEAWAEWADRAEQDRKAICSDPERRRAFRTNPDIKPEAREMGTEHETAGQYETAAKRIERERRMSKT